MNNFFKKNEHIERKPETVGNGDRVDLAERRVVADSISLQKSLAA
jgi:hypothetical protein